MDNTLELLIMAWDCFLNPCQDLWVIEWNGEEFVNLIGESEENPVGADALFDWELQDIDQNGTIEIILKDHVPVWSTYTSGLPWREMTETFKWNGSKFAIYQEEFAPPQYRFQATQDGDLATLAGEYDRAESLYQQAILSKTLDWWSPDRQAYERAKYDSQYTNTSSTSTPLSVPSPDPGEYSSLIAYARYRLMLLNILWGRIDEAQVIYDSLQEQYSPGKIGNEYAEMATAFWFEYQKSQNINLACRKAVEYAGAHQREILMYLGNVSILGTDPPIEQNYHGWQSLLYEPKDICPFK